MRHLPLIAKGDVGLYVVGFDGELLSESAAAEPIAFRVVEGLLQVEVRADRRCRVEPIAGRPDWLVLTYTAAEAAVVEPFLAAMFDSLAEKDQLRQDMESMYSSSLALLEEVSMVGDMLPRLPTGDTELDVVQMGLEALIVAASVESAIFVRYDDRRDLAEVLLQVTSDSGVVESYPGERFLTGGLAWEAIGGSGEALLQAVPAGGCLGEPGSPESLAEREIIAVPVRFGGNDKPVTLGALMVLDKRANAYSITDEFGSQDTKLATSVAAMLGSVLGTRKVADLGNEMRTAQVLHQQILPDSSPEFPGFDLAGHSESPGAVGGDYYDFLPLPDGRLMCVVADVSGHNLASCLIMVGARAALRQIALITRDSAAVFDQLARSLFPDLTRTELFITAAGATIAPATRTLELVNAGHNPTMIYRAATAAIEEVFANDTVIGFLPSPGHELVERTLEPGDVVLLYTDGVTEAANMAGEFFGEERLRQTLIGAAAGGAAEILERVNQAVADWVGEAEEGDDISVVVIKVNE